MTVSIRDEGTTHFGFNLSSDGIKTKAMDRIHDFALTEDDRIAFVAAGLHLRCLDLEAGIELWRYRPTNVFGFLQSSPRAVAVTRNKNVWVCNDNSTMDVFRPDGSSVSHWRANDTPNMVSRMHNGDWYVASDGYGITVWDPEDQRRVTRIRSTVRVYALKAFPKEDKVVVRSDVGVSILDLFTGTTLRTFGVLPGLPYVDVSHDGRTILIGEGRGVAVYDIDGNHLAHYKASGDRVLTAVFHPERRTVIGGLASGHVAELPASDR